ASKSRSRTASVSRRNASRSRSVAKSSIRFSGHVATNPVDAGGRSARARGEPRNQAESPVAWIPTGDRRKVSEGESGDAARLFGLTRNVPDVIILYRRVARTRA